MYHGKRTLFASSQYLLTPKKGHDPQSTSVKNHHPPNPIPTPLDQGVGEKRVVRMFWLRTKDHVFKFLWGFSVVVQHVVPHLVSLSMNFLKRYSLGLTEEYINSDYIQIRTLLQCVLYDLRISILRLGDSLVH